MSLNITSPGFIIISASQGSGKSHLIKYLVSKHKKDIDYTIVFCNTSFDEGYDYIPKKYIHPMYDEDALNNLMNIQAKLVKKGIKKNCWVIFDDCLFDGQFKSKPFLRLSTQLRHYNITCIISTQYPQIIKPQFRNNCFQVGMFKTSTMNALQALYTSYGMEFETFNDFKKYLNDSTNQKYNFVWFDKTIEGDIKKKYQVSRCPKKINNFMLEYNTEI